MKLISVDNYTNDIVITGSTTNNTYTRSLVDFILTGQHEDLSIKDKQTLREQTMSNPLIHSEKGPNGDVSFGLSNMLSALSLLQILFVSIGIVCCFLFFNKVDFLGFEIPSGGLIFPVTYVLLDAISELYGRNRARLTIIINFVAVSMLAACIYLSLNYLPSSLPKAEAAIFEKTLLPVPHLLMSFAIGVLLADWINVNIFHFIRSKT